LNGTLTQIRSGFQAWYFAATSSIAFSVSVVSSTDTSPRDTSMTSLMRVSRSTLPPSFAMMSGLVVVPERMPQAPMSLISLGSELSRKIMFDRDREYHGPRRAAWLHDSPEPKRALREAGKVRIDYRRREAPRARPPHERPRRQRPNRRSSTSFR